MFWCADPLQVFNVLDHHEGNEIFHVCFHKFALLWLYFQWGAGTIVEFLYRFSFNSLTCAGFLLWRRSQIMSSISRRSTCSLLFPIGETSYLPHQKLPLAKQVLNFLLCPYQVQGKDSIQLHSPWQLRPQCSTHLHTRFHCSHHLRGWIYGEDREIHGIYVQRRRGYLLCWERELPIVGSQIESQTGCLITSHCTPRNIMEVSWGICD